MFSILSLNANGIRSAIKKELSHKISLIDNEQCLKHLCIQEVRAMDAECPDFLGGNNHSLHALHALHKKVISVAEKKGYSGTGIYSIDTVNNHANNHANISNFWHHEGRCCSIETEEMIVVSLYFPSGSSSNERQQQKLQFLNELKPQLHELLNNVKPVILCGDWNIAHQNIDLKNWKGNIEKPGCTTIERNWFSEQLKNGWQDVFRHHYPDTEAYTWWSLRGNARANNVGWRIDYFWSNLAWQKTYQTIKIDILRDWNVSDHAPLLASFERKLTT